jgi:CubicO group peptidase (beta-lactamase class C family)
MEALDAHGGWIASAADLARFAAAVDGQRPPALLSSASVDAMLNTPRPATEDGEAGAGNAAPTLGLGWVVQPQPKNNGADWSHAGALEGSNASWLLRTHDGVTIACSFNTLPEDFPRFFGDLTTVLPATAREVSTWPMHDLFAQT